VAAVRLAVSHRAAVTDDEKSLSEVVAVGRFELFL
jgi:hypothetical protein